MAQLDRVAPPGNRARTEFIRSAIKAALHHIEFDRIRKSYLREPKVFQEGGDWADPLEWNPQASS